MAIEAVRECGEELLPHPSHPPDLAPSNFHLFPRVNKHRRGWRFGGDDDELTSDDVEGWLSGTKVWRSDIND